MNYYLFLTVVTILYTSGVQSYVNHYDGDLNFECPQGHYISGIESVHSNRREDRRWKYRCREGFVDVNECAWTNYVNNMDGPMDWTCPGNGLLVGANSYHNSKHEDRQWKFKCCTAKAIRRNCHWKKLNNYDKRMSYNVNRGLAIIGFKSIHNNRREDRVWTARVCKYSTCQAKKMRILSTVKPTLEEVRIVGITSSQGCSKDAKYTTSLQNTDSVTETSSFTTSKGKLFTYSTSLSVEASFGVNILGIGGGITVGVEESFGGSTKWSSSTTKETSTKTSSSAGQSLEYKGPGGALIMGYVQSYKFDNNNVDVEYDVQCDDGSRFKEKATASFKLTRFSQTHFVQTHGIFNSPQDCSRQSNECIQSVNGKKAFQPYEIEKEFENCFK